MEYPISGQRRSDLRSSSKTVEFNPEKTRLNDQPQRSLLDGWQRASGSGGPDGRSQWTYGSLPSAGRLPFDVVVAPSGYVWWYLDAVSDDGRYALTLIAFVGSVFSPRYFRARQKALNGLVDANDFCTLNVAIHGPGQAESWVFTEFSSEEITRNASEFVLGDSRLHRDESGLTIDLNARTKPFFQRMNTHVRGRIRLKPSAPYERIVSLDANQRHRWIGLAPRARVQVELQEPNLTFSGSAYHDANQGLEPLENAFRYWNWSRAELSQGTLVLYDTMETDGSYKESARLYQPDGGIVDVDVDQQCHLKSGAWGIKRRTRADQGSHARIEKTLVDAPFYTRSLMRTRLLGESSIAVHETVDLQRFQAPWVRFLLPWKIRQSSLSKRGP